MSDEIAVPTNDLATQIEFARLVTTKPDGPRQGQSILPESYRDNPANVLVAVGLGSAMGLSPAESLYRISVIKGKPSASAELIAANVRKAGHKLRIKVTENPPHATCTIIRADDPDEPVTIERDMAWATRMGLAGEPNYKKQPATMLSYRAITACARLACPEALYGVSYTPEEAASLPDEQPVVQAAASDFLKAEVVQPAATRADTGEAITPEQVGDLVTLMTRKGITGAARLSGTRHIVQRDVESLDELTAAEYATVVDALATREDAEGES